MAIGWAGNQERHHGGSLAIKLRQPGRLIFLGSMQPWAMCVPSMTIQDSVRSTAS
jgi:hypothetical protein